jgi:hypothetical protein
MTLSLEQALLIESIVTFQSRCQRGVGAAINLRTPFFWAARRRVLVRSAIRERSNWGLESHDPHYVE